jgi:hypothetical protein
MNHNLINCDCNDVMAVVFANVSVCTALKAVVAYSISHEPTVARVLLLQQLRMLFQSNI